mmetsp:Transcript_7825/g.9702  ORF Transcript_7825/g.9702 Transcript_7825/m.9702 type:complete len:100 (+) Transcript_7825:2-301(+)
MHKTDTGYKLLARYCPFLSVLPVPLLPSPSGFVVPGLLRLLLKKQIHLEDFFINQPSKGLIRHSPVEITLRNLIQKTFFPASFAFPFALVRLCYQQNRF